MSKLSFGSLFAGIGGFDLGFERAGFECRWQVEIDDYATKILEKHWPKVHRQRDIRECNASNLERVDCIIGGFPCQDLSYAGRGAGLHGERSGLFFEAIRLVRELRPRAVVLENVAALLTRGLDRVLWTLAEIGYDAQWHCIPAAYVGAPHIRDRIFIIATPADSNSCRLKEFQKCNCKSKTRKQTQQRNYALRLCNDVADSNTERLQEWQGQKPSGKRKKKWPDIGRSGWWDTEPSVGRVATRVPRRVDRLRCLGNAIVPQVAEVVANLTLHKLALQKISET